MTVEALAAGAIAVLAPYVAAGATKTAETIGEDMGRKLGGLLGKVRGWLSREDRSARAFEQFEADPTLYAIPAEKVLVDRLAEEPAFVRELADLLDGLGSNLVVEQKIGELAGSVTGMDVGAVRSALRARVIQDVGTVAAGGKLTGMRIGKT